MTARPSTKLRQHRGNTLDRMPGNGESLNSEKDELMRNKHLSLKPAGS